MNLFYQLFHNCLIGSFSIIVKLVKFFFIAIYFFFEYSLKKTNSLPLFAIYRPSQKYSCFDIKTPYVKGLRERYTK